jgi:hypothetical protein
LPHLCPLEGFNQGQILPKPIVHTGLPPAAYTDPAILERERGTLFRTLWQWAGLTGDLKKSNGIATEIAGLPITVSGVPGDLRVYLHAGQQHEELPGAEADHCGHFVFVRLAPGGPSLTDYLGDYAAVLEHCTENFDETYHMHAEDWACNWKAGIEITLEGYHVPIVHSDSEFDKKVPKSVPPIYNGPHSYGCGLMGEKMRGEMANIAKRLKISQSTLYKNYDHFTIFPNMTIGLSGGCLCFMQIYTPLAVNRTRLRYAYILARLADPTQMPVAPIKAALLDKWRTFTKLVLSEDQGACERFQLGVGHATKPGLIGHYYEERVAHFHKYWRAAMGMQSEPAEAGTRAA